MITINNTSGNPMLLIDDDGALWQATPLGKPDRRVGFKHVESLGFHLCYHRPDLVGGTVWLYKRNDGTQLRRHEDADDRVWWDTGESISKPADVDKVRKDNARLFGDDGRGSQPAKARWS